MKIVMWGFCCFMFRDMVSFSPRWLWTHVFIAIWSSTFSPPAFTSQVLTQPDIAVHYLNALKISEKILKMYGTVLCLHPEGMLHFFKRLVEDSIFILPQTNLPGYHSPEMDSVHCSIRGCLKRTRSVLSHPLATWPFGSTLTHLTFIS